MTRHLIWCGLLCGGLLAPLPAQPPAAEPGPAIVAPGDPAPSGEARRKKDQAGVLLLMMVCLPFGLALAATARTGLSLGLASLWPGLVSRAALRLEARPWLAIAWGALIFVLGFTLAVILGKLGDGGGLLALLVLAALVLAGAVGSSGLCEVIGERAYELMPHRHPSRFACLAVGSVLLVLTLATPPGWLLIPFAIAASLGAFRLGLPRGSADRHREPAPALDPA